MRDAPKPRPSAWDSCCPHCGSRRRDEAEHHEHSSGCTGSGCYGQEWGKPGPYCCGKPDNPATARWGAEWAAVAWLCLSVTARANQRESDGSMIPFRVLHHEALNEYRAALDRAPLRKSVWV